MIELQKLTLRPGESEKKLRKLTEKALRLQPEDILTFEIAKKSLDARKKRDIHYVYAVHLTVAGDEAEIAARNRNASVQQPYAYEIPKAALPERPVIVGFGPAGMFAALVLTYAGARPIVLERGGDVDSRQKAVDLLRSGGPLDPENNVQFGEGGAGTFSDGKLNTNTHDFRNRWVLDEFARHGAPAQIRYDAKPHIGTDILVRVVRQIRETVIAGGGEVRFGAKLTGLRQENGAVTGVEVNGAEVIPTRDVILAIGHSARDTVTMLHELGLPMEQKPFAMGVRIEQSQIVINKAQYGGLDPKLPAADYKLVAHLQDRTVYTFCMCPGGYVVAAASEAGGVVTNGMSYSGRKGENANAALLVSLNPADFPGTDPLSGMRWQREIEEKAFAAGGGNYHAPAQRVADFQAHRPSTTPGSVQPTYRPGVTWTDLHEVLPKVLTDALEEALPVLEKRLPGFAPADAVLTAPESRSSSPVRLLRDETRQSALRGLYPAGEGAGYAGGIMSAAVDGILSAEALLESL